jgi:hypothetical protein
MTQDDQNEKVLKHVQDTLDLYQSEPLDNKTLATAKPNMGRFDDPAHWDKTVGDYERIQNKLNNNESLLDEKLGNLGAFKEAYLQENPELALKDNVEKTTKPKSTYQREFGEYGSYHTKRKIRERMERNLKNKKPLYDGFTTDDIIIAEPIRKASKRLAIIRKSEDKPSIKIDIKNLQNFSEQEKKEDDFFKRFEKKSDPDLQKGLGTLTDLIKR